MRDVGRRRVSYSPGVLEESSCGQMRSTEEDRLNIKSRLSDESSAVVLVTTRASLSAGLLKGENRVFVRSNRV
ncbi:hypothetical protein RRG08_021850 [Elysia crispata]|uniref:Uncharacterized protein n=1 Tax=Elysia crispata TaxID=231223 RepID=A0AAE0YGC7_9GAST|nr:hypothetical protein RRG08_021850 [Elysia crispata]